MEKLFFVFLHFSPTKKLEAEHIARNVYLFSFFIVSTLTVYIFFCFIFFIQHTQLHTRFFIYFFLLLAAYANVFIHIYFLRKKCYLITALKLECFIFYFFFAFKPFLRVIFLTYKIINEIRGGKIKQVLLVAVFKIVILKVNIIKIYRNNENKNEEWMEFFMVPKVFSLVLLCSCLYSVENFVNWVNLWMGMNDENLFLIAVKKILLKLWVV